MTKRMLVDATHPEETRVAIVDERRLEDFDFESTTKKQLKGNIYLAKVIRIEPSLQAAFVEYGGNRHGFLPFSEIHPDYFRIPVADRPHDEEDAFAEEGEEETLASEGGDDADEHETSSDAALAEEVKAYQDEPLDHDDEHGHVQASVADAAAEGGADETAAAKEEKKTEGEQQTTLEPVEGATTPFVGETLISTAEGEGDAGVLGSSDADLNSGLITDFGNAAVGPVFVPVPAPVDTIGGQEEEEEQVRRRRMPRYKIQEVVKRRQIMLIQVVKEERGNKGAALTTFLSLAGRYCVLMPNTDRGGGVSRKITSHQDRRRMKEVLDQLETPEGMAVILRTAGMEQEPSEIQRDLEHLLRLWNTIREQTLISTAPKLIYEEANLIKRSIRDLYAADVEEVLVAGEQGHTLAHEFMRSLMPEAQDKVKRYDDPVPLFFRYNVEKQIDQLYNPVVQLRSGGYIVINPTEALVSIDVNSGRATRERHIEGTALKTNLEAADEIARQLRLRDLAGLVVIDFIDMEDGRNNAAVERRMKEAMKSDRARLQIGRLSPFGLMELSRQRLHPSLTEINFEKCPHCGGVGLVRSVDSSAISILRQIEEDAIRQPGGEIVLHVPTNVALYILNQKRGVLHDIETRYGLQVFLHSDDTLIPPDCRLERSKGASSGSKSRAPAVDIDKILAEEVDVDASDASGNAKTAEEGGDKPRSERGSRRRGRVGRGGRRGGRASSSDKAAEKAGGEDIDGNVAAPEELLPADNIGNMIDADAAASEKDDTRNAPQGDGNGGRQGSRRRGRRGGRGRRNTKGEPRGDADAGDAPAVGGSSFAPIEPPGSYIPPSIPVSIHDLDTTPRDPREEKAQGSSRPVTFAPPPSPYEVTNPEGDRPKGGWWRKLTGQ